MVTNLDKGSLKGIRLDGQIIPSTTDNVQIQARYVQVTPDSEDLNSILGLTGITGSASGGCANNLYDVLSSMSNKIGNIVNPLKFKGVIIKGAQLPVKDVAVGDVYHLNTDLNVTVNNNVISYHVGDEVVCILVTPGKDGANDTIIWELLGRNTVDITSIPTGDITIENLESVATV